MWILILTLVAAQSSNGQAMTSVPGFDSEAACISAAEKWKSKVHETGPSFRMPVAVCVKRA